MTQWTVSFILKANEEITKGDIKTHLGLLAEDLLVKLQYVKITKEG